MPLNSVCLVSALAWRFYHKPLDSHFLIMISKLAYKPSLLILMPKLPNQESIRINLSAESASHSTVVVFSHNKLVSNIMTF